MGGQRDEREGASAEVRTPPMTESSSDHLASEEPHQVAAPVAPEERIVPLDVLRGVALLGILLMNIRFFAMIGAAYENPTAYGDLHGANYVVWYSTALLADAKFLAIFSMLFGAGMILMA